MRVKGILLAGGKGTRLLPMTRVLNKHLLPCYDRPMIYYPLERLVKAGCSEILIITSDEHAGDFISLLGDGSEWGAVFTYKIQRDANGIAGALALAESFVGADEGCLVILGDNYIEHDISISPFFTDNAMIWLKEVTDPKRFGVATIDSDGVVTGIEEKPKEPKSNYAVIGAYYYPSDVFKKIKMVKPSARGELEITDINNLYIKENRLIGDRIDSHWQDLGTVESLFSGSVHARNNIDKWSKVKP
jgi:glucose-1-phosphate thymidylyltransferase